MARRSNKTAHVLNLLAGHDAQNASQDDSQNTAVDTADKNSTDSSSDNPSASGTSSSPSADGKAADTTVAPVKEPEKPAAASVTAQNISVIDKTEDDPVADLIQQKLMDEFEKISNSEPDSAAAEAEAADEALEEAAADSSADTKTEPEDPVDTIAEAVEASVPDTDISPVSQTSQPETGSEPEAAPEDDETSSAPPADTEPEAAEASAAPEPAPEAQQSVSQAAAPEPEPTPEPTPESEPEPEPTPEPEFAYLNIMERIVEDKIIYFMRQFDVCTCDRCKADTIALTMNGLMPRYIVTTPAAVDPLLSYYTNRLISDVTVEATKACMVVKENPRH